MCMRVGRCVCVFAVCVGVYVGCVWVWRWGVSVWGWEYVCGSVDVWVYDVCRCVYERERKEERGRFLPYSSACILLLSPYLGNFSKQNSPLKQLFFSPSSLHQI